MEGDEVGPSNSTKSKEPRSRKRKESRLSLIELRGSTTESKTTHKKNNQIVYASLERGQSSSSPADGDSKVVLALYCPGKMSTETKKVRKKKKLPSSLESNNLVGNALCKVENQELPVSETLEVASKTAGEHEEMCGVLHKKKRTRVGKRRTDQGNKPPSDSGRNKLSINLEDNRSRQNVVDQVQEDSVDKRLASAAKTVDEREEVCVVQQKKKRTRLGKRHTDEENKSLMESGRNTLSKSSESNHPPLESGRNLPSPTLENNHSDKKLLDQSQEVTVNRGLEAVSKMTDEYQIVCGVQHKKRKKEGKKPTDQEDKPLLGSGRNKVSKTSENIHLEQNSMEELKAGPLVNHKVKNSISNKVQDRELLVRNSLEAASQTADEQEVCATKHKSKKVVKTRADQENTNLLGSGCTSISDMTNTEQLNLETSVPELPELDLTRKEKTKEVLSDNSLSAAQSRSLPDCTSTCLPNNQNDSRETEVLPLVVLKSYKTYQRKDKQFCTLDNNLERSTDEGWGEPPLKHPNDLKKKGRRTKIAETKAAQSTHQAKTLSSISRHNIGDDNTPQEDEGDLSRVGKTVQGCHLFSEQTIGDSPTDCRKENSLSLLESNDHVGDSYSYNIRLEAMSKQGNPSELCEEGYITLPQNDKVLSANESSANLSNKSSASRKRARKDKIKHTSHEANASHDSTILHPSTEQLNCSLVDGAIECQMKEIAPSVGDIKNDTVILSTEMRGDECVERSASPERAPSGNTRRKLLILDLNGLLVDIVSALSDGYKADKRVAKKSLLKRPFCDDFLKFCFEKFNVGIWSSRTKRNVDNVVDYIMGDMRHKLLFCWDQSHCTQTGFSTVEEVHKPMVLKELKKLWDKHERKGEPRLPWEKGEYNESNTILVDDSPYKALLNPRHTAIFPCSYDYQKRSDNSLGPGGDIRMYLENLATAQHVQKYIEQNPFGAAGQRAITSNDPSWGYYLRVIKANNFRLPT